MRPYRESLLAIKRNYKALLSFLLLCQAAYAAVVVPLLRLASYGIMQLVGFRYLTAENIYRFFHHPIAFIGVIALGVMYAAFEMIEVGGILYLIDRSRNAQHVTLVQVFSFSLRNVIQLWRPHYFNLLLWLLIMTPFYHLASTINTVNSSSFLSILLKSLLKQQFSRTLLMVVILLLLVFFLRWMAVCPLYTLQNYSLHQATRRSEHMMRQARFGQILAVFVFQVALFFLFAFASLLIPQLIGLWKDSHWLSAVYVTSLQAVSVQILSRLLSALSLLTALLSISCIYYHGAEKPLIYAKRVDAPRRVFKQKGSERHLSGRGEMLVLLGSLAIFFFYHFSDAQSNYRLRIEHLATVEVTAHRGASMYYPENTMVAFRGAVEQAAQWIELDVQLTADGEVIVLHDESLKRTTGVDKKAWELTYAEIAQLDAGSFFSEEFAGERIPSLSEVLSYAKEVGVKLNIELKPNDHTQDLVDKVIDLIHEYDFGDQCVITSQRYEALRQVKKTDETIYTVYVMGLAYGAINRLKAADAFSIRAASLTQSLVTDLHNRGLEVFAWTVDSRSNLNRMIDLGVDNIITNNVPLGIECINSSRTDSLLKNLIQTQGDES